MPKIKDFLTRKQYLANYGDGDRTSDEQYEVTVSNYVEIYQLLRESINNPDEISRLLQSEFIYPDAISNKTTIPFDTFPKEPFIIEKKPTFHIGIDGVCPPYVTYEFKTYENPDYGKGQKDTFSYTQYNTAITLEELLRNHSEDFRDLLEIATPEVKKILLNFTSLDLSEIDICDLPIELINFTGSDLRFTTNITQELLDRSQTYVNAQLPEGIIPFLNTQTQNNINEYIKQLADYGQKLLKSNFKSGREEGELILDLTTNLNKKINSTNKYNGKFQKEFLHILHSHDKEFNHHRFYAVKMIIANIVLCILGLVVGYVAAGLYNYQSTGKFLFFSKTDTERHIQSLEGTLPLRI